MKPVKCNNCGWTGDIEDGDAFRDFWSRYDLLLEQPGALCPACDCPKCGEFAYLVKEQPDEEREFIEAATIMYGGGDDIQFDELCKVSVGEGGAYVQGWMWVSDDDVALTLGKEPNP